MKEFSKETIEIGGKEYTLFLNRKGVVAFEKVAKVSELAHELMPKYKEMLDTDLDISSSKNPIEDFGEEFSEEDEDLARLRTIYKKFYWIVLSTNHPMLYEESIPLFEQAEKEYGIDQLIELASQMIDDVNAMPEGEEPKKLKALRPKTK